MLCVRHDIMLPRNAFYDQVFSHKHVLLPKKLSFPKIREMFTLVEMFSWHWKMQGNQLLKFCDTLMELYANS